MAFTITPYNATMPGNFMRFFQVTADDGDTASSNEQHGFKGVPQLCTIFTVDGTDIVTTGDWRVQLVGDFNFKVKKSAGAGTGGTVRVCIGAIPGNFGT